MDNPLYVFEANASKEMTTLIVAIVATLLAIGFLYYLKKRPENYERRHYKQLGQMLSGFVLIISLGSVVGGIFNLQRLQSVKIYKDYVETGYGKVRFNDLRYVYLQETGATSFLAPSIRIDTVYLAYFEERNGKSYVLSNQHYDVRSIVHTLRPILDGQ